jgi:hypothetical protein
MGKKCYRMRSRACEKKLKRRRLFGERHFLDADARLNQMGERDAGDEAKGGDPGDKPVPAAARNERTVYFRKQLRAARAMGLYVSRACP